MDEPGSQQKHLAQADNPEGSPQPSISLLGRALGWVLPLWWIAVSCWLSCWHLARVDHGHSAPVSPTDVESFFTQAWWAASALALLWCLSGRLATASRATAALRKLVWVMVFLFDAILPSILVAERVANWVWPMRGISELEDGTPVKAGMFGIEVPLVFALCLLCGLLYLRYAGRQKTMAWAAMASCLLYRIVFLAT